MTGEVTRLFSARGFKGEGKMRTQRGISQSVTTAMLVAVLSCSGLFAKPKEKVYNNTPQEVFQAALRTARERHVVTYVNEKNLMLTFETGTSAFSYGFNANASVEQMPDGKSKLIINVQKKNAGKDASISFGAGNRMADKFFQQVEEELARASSQKTAVKPETPHVEAPPGARPTAATNDGTGQIDVSAVPDGADISVDGNFIGSAPATLKLGGGKHVISVTHQGFKAWTREVSVLPGSQVSLKATLEKD
jgi:hypothetical protein